ncbi:MAG: peptidylprolyl isomerase [Flavobacteriales bacterium]|nr:peptidylprolyl isomerase [Flavobacteriales bacterium]
MIARALTHKLVFLLALLPAEGALWAQEGMAARRSLVELNTPQGRMILALFNETPQHRDNFLELVRTRYYDSTLVHRATPEFVIEGGDPESKIAAPGAPLGKGGPGYTLESEPRTSLHPFRGALAAAPPSGQEDPLKRTHGSQFFIVLGRNYENADLDRLAERAKAQGEELTFSAESRAAYGSIGGLPHMDGHYTVFGEVLEGLDVLDAIANQPCNQEDRPLTDVRIWMRELP